MPLDQYARANLLKPFPEDLIPFIEYNKQLWVWYRIANKLPLRPHDDILSAIRQQDAQKFELAMSKYSPESGPIVINTVKDAETVLGLGSITNFATEKRSVAKLGFRILPHAVAELSVDEQLKLISELPPIAICSLDTSRSSPLAHLRQAVLANTKNARARL